MAEVNNVQQAQQFANEVRAWQSEMASWHTEMLFMLRLADIYGLKEHDPAGLRHLDRMKEGSKRFLATLADHGQHLRSHEEHVRKVAEDRLLNRDRDLPYRHNDHKTATDRLRAEFRQWHEALYTTIDQLRQL